MTLKQFNADTAAAAARIAAQAFAGVIALRKGESDGEVVVTYCHDSLEMPLRIQLLVPNTEEYPSRSSFLIFTDNEDVPAGLPSALAQLQDVSMGTDISAMLTLLSKSLAQTLEATGDDYQAESDNDMELGSDSDEYDGFDEYDSDDDVYDSFGLVSDGAAETENGCLPRRLKEDLREARENGYRVGIVLVSATSCILSISVRASKFRLPETTLEVWDIKPEEYVVLLIRYVGKYTPYEDMIRGQFSISRPSTNFRIGKSSHYKPSYSAAVKAFSNTVRSSDDEQKNLLLCESSPTEFSKIFVSNSLDQFLTESFFPLMAIRQAESKSWDQANDILLGRQHMIVPNNENLSAEVGDDQPIWNKTTVPEKFRRDHLSEAEGTQRSWPLIAMQFAMRYYLVCTRFCLRCHRRTGADIETLKPYVCSNPLCLFQYLSMGLGPSLEHEIRTQPRVVDLLVSFCYSSLGTSRRPWLGPGRTMSSSGTTQDSCAIREFPVGLQLRIPDIRDKPLIPHIPGWLNSGYSTFKANNREDIDRIATKQWIALRFEFQAAKWDNTSSSVLPMGQSTQRVHGGDLIHAQIKSIDFSTKTIVLENVSTSGLGTTIPGSAPGEPDREAFILPYESDFNDLETADKGLVMAHLLDTLPRISIIKAALDNNTALRVKEIPGISQAAASLLDWIVASNRSCIFETDHGNADSDSTGKSSASQSATVRDLPGWVQFRFLQGSPDKESRFQAAREVVKSTKNRSWPSLFAWHGSNLANWHSIVRVGLDYSDVRNGRAYGNGVYFSLDLKTSIQYMNGTTFFGIWPNSELQITGAISLNEVVNSPGDFVSRAPHLVVAQNDWHMCRFLLVNSKSAQEPSSEQQAQQKKEATPPPPDIPQSACLEQDPLMTPRGPDGKALRIPLAALPSYHQGKFKNGPCVVEISDNSSDEHQSDVDYLASDDEVMEDAPNIDAEPLKVTLDISRTDFRPGTLDLASLPRLQPPSWATNAALRNISVQVKQLQAIQQRTPVHELGWYIDFDQLENVFQWIVELHSFDASLSLAADMKRAGVTSVVCEVRFGPQYPYTPPFVRVIRPRFLPFVRGGGGHVTAGGAMCMELLTNSGWSPASSVESVLLQVRMAMLSADPRPARLEPTAAGAGQADYGIGEAVDAYIRAATMHGWQVPPDIRRMTTEYNLA